jgi:hypothetical protein
VGVPVVALAAAATVRMWYMHSFYPDALSPSKERKVRTAGLACRIVYALP